MLGLALALIALAGCGSSTKVVTDSAATSATGTSPTTATTTTAAGTTSTSQSNTVTTRTSSTPTTTTSTSSPTGGASPATSTTSPGTRTTPAASPYEPSCGGSYENVSGLPCGQALPVMNAWNTSGGCEVADQYGSPTTSSCDVQGYACSARLGYRPGQTEGERSAVVACRSGATSLSFIRGA
jgi:hypothetical protein